MGSVVGSVEFIGLNVGSTVGSEELIKLLSKPKMEPTFKTLNSVGLSSLASVSSTTLSFENGNF